MRLADVVDVSRAVAGSSGRLEKTAHLADFLKRTPADDIAIVVGFLTGDARQGRLKIGYAQLTAMRDVPPQPRLRSTSARLGRRLRSGCADCRPFRRRIGARAVRVRCAICSAAPPLTSRTFCPPAVRRAASGRARRRPGRSGRARAPALPGCRVRRAAMLAGETAPGRARRARRRRRGALALRRSSCSSRFSRCSPIRRPTSTTRWPISAKRRSSTSSMARASRCTRSDDEVRVFSRNLRDVTAAVPEVVDVVRAMPARRLCSTAKRSRCGPTAAAAVPDHDAAVRTQAGCGSACRRSCRSRRCFFDASISTARRSSTSRCRGDSRRSTSRSRPRAAACPGSITSRIGRRPMPRFAARALARAMKA